MKQIEFGRLVIVRCQTLIGHEVCSFFSAQTRQKDFRHIKTPIYHIVFLLCVFIMGDVLVGGLEHAFFFHISIYIYIYWE